MITNVDYTWEFILNFINRQIETLLTLDKSKQRSLACVLIRGVRSINQKGECCIVTKVGKADQRGVRKSLTLIYKCEPRKLNTNTNTLKMQSKHKYNYKIQVKRRVRKWLTIFTSFSKYICLKWFSKIYLICPVETVKQMYVRGFYCLVSASRPLHPLPFSLHFCNIFVSHIVCIVCVASL